MARSKFYPDERPAVGRVHVRLPKAIFDLVQERATAQRSSMNTVITNALRSTMSPCPTCGGTGVEPKDDPAPLATAGVATAQGASHEQQHKPSRDG